jgi:hypothetical protein
VKDESANILWNLNQHSNDNIMYLLQIQRNQNTEDEIMKKIPAKTRKMVPTTLLVEKRN